MNIEYRAKSFLSVKLLLLSGFGLLMVSPLSQARTLKVGDEYGGGVVIYLFPQDEGRFKKSADEVMIAGETKMSEHLYWSHLKTASDKFRGNLYSDWVEPGRVSSGNGAGIAAVERDVHNGSW